MSETTENSTEQQQSQEQQSGEQKSSEQNSNSASEQKSQQSSGQNSSSSRSSSDWKVEDLPAGAQKLINDLRKEAGDNRTGKNAAEQKQADMLDAIGKALGLKKDEQPTVEDLAKQLADKDSELYTMRVERAMAAAARKHNADPELLTAVLAYKGSLDDLDPTAKDFTDKLDTLVKDAVKNNQKLRSAQAAGASSVDHSGGTGERRSDQPKSLADAVSNHYGT